MSDGGGGDCGGFGDFGGGYDGGCHHTPDGGAHHHYYDGGGYYYYDGGTGAEGAMGASGEVQKRATLMERISAMSGWQKVGAVLGVAAVVDGIRRVFSNGPSSLKEDATPEEKKAAFNEQALA